MAIPRRSEPDRRDGMCARCSKPIPPGTAARLSGTPVHVRCLARETQLESLEQQARSGEARLRALAAIQRVEALIDGLRDRQTRCPVCQAALVGRRGLLFRDGRLVHHECAPNEPPTRE
ncbi:MAG TPA: hypothetical protein VLA62_03195 [Solirubrobacterales bacterium]|nr:hypothetical protein [Solirubrobacterales bacterium]